MLAKKHEAKMDNLSTFIIKYGSAQLGIHKNKHQQKVCMDKVEVKHKHDCRQL